MPAAKPTGDHERDGTFRKDRHEDRADSLYPKGPPSQPEGLDGHARWLWSLVVENVPGRVISPADAAELLMLCVWWSQFRTLSDDLENETNAEKRLFVLNQLAMSSKRVADGLKHFGMHPAARTAIKVGGKPAKGQGAFAVLLEMQRSRTIPARN